MVYFATNRMAQGPTTDWRSYGPDIVLPTDPSLIIYAADFVEGTDLGVEGGGAITAISHAEAGAFHPSVSQDILGSGKNIVVFIHGFANSFLNSITRVAFNREWFCRRRRKRRGHHCCRVRLAVFGSARRRRAFSPPITCATKARPAGRAFTLRACSAIFSRC
jgi:hypothetical protein